MGPQVPWDFWCNKAHPEVQDISPTLALSSFLIRDTVEMLPTAHAALRRCHWLWP